MVPTSFSQPGPVFSAGLALSNEIIMPEGPGKKISSQGFDYMVEFLMPPASPRPRRGRKGRIYLKKC